MEMEIIIKWLARWTLLGLVICVLIPKGRVPETEQGAILWTFLLGPAVWVGVSLIVYGKYIREKKSTEKE